MNLRNEAGKLRDFDKKLRDFTMDLRNEAENLRDFEKKLRNKG